MSGVDVSGEDVVRLLIYYTHSHWIYVYRCPYPDCRQHQRDRLGYIMYVH